MNGYYFSIIRRCEMFYMHGQMERFGLFPLEGRLIHMLKDHCCSQEELGEFLNLDKGRIAKAIFTLEKNGLISRKVNEQNRRQKLVSLTREGEVIYERICEIDKAWEDICYTGFNEEEKRLHQSFVARMAANAVEYRKKNGGKING